MTMFYECGYLIRIAYLIFLIITILTQLFLLWLLIKWKCGKRKVFFCANGLLGNFVLYSVLLDDHIMPLVEVSWQRRNEAIPILLLWGVTITVFAISGLLILKTSEQYRKTVSEESIKEALDEVPLAICYFKKDGIPMLCNRRMQEISEIMSDRIFMSYSELKQILASCEQWREEGDVFYLPDGTVCRYAEEEVRAADGERYLVSNFFDITELAQRKQELEAQNEELRRMSVELRRLKDNGRLLAKEEEILAIKARWHDVMGEGLAAIRRALLSRQPREITDIALERWWEAVSTIQRDNDDPDQRRDAIGDLLRDALGLQIQLTLEGKMPEDKKTEEVFILAVRNCLLNAAQHAKATELYADISQTETENVLSVTNNGVGPKREITPRGGLINVKNYAERIGGRTEIMSSPRFELRVTVPRKDG